MKTIVRFILCFATIIVASCSGDMENLQNNNGDMIEKCPVLESEAITRGLEEAKQMTDAVSKERNREVGETEFFVTNTRGEMADNYGFYIVNYMDGGFAILSGDSQNPKVYAFSDKGSIHLSDTLDNKGLNWYLNDYLANAGGSGYTKPVLPPLQPFEYAFVAPFLPENLTVFSQGSPWNKYCPFIETRQCLVGCAPLATGTIMGYYGWPESYKGYSFDWLSMKADNKHDSWAKLFYFIGLPENMNVSYGVNGTGAYKDTYVPTYNNMGYPNAKLADFNITGILYPQFMKKQPVMARGSRTSSGHAWVMDGIYAEKNTDSTFTNSENPDYSFYTHCIWGWGGSNNGYFLISDYSITVGDREYNNLQVVYDFTH